MVGSIFVNNYTTISNLLRHPAKTSSVWEFGNSIFKGPVNNGSSVLDVSRYFDDIYQAVSDKAKAGFQTSITDYWGRALSYQLIDATDGGPSYTWSSIAKDQNFAIGDTPLPLLVADGRAPGETVISTNSTVFEFNPWELGTWDPTIFGFAPLEFLGSNFTNGALPSGQKCVRGFDNAGYVMGTSSSLFNAFLLNIDSPYLPDIPTLARKFVTRILQTFNQTNNDIADYSPNPFYGYHNVTNLGSQSERLTLVDGGEDLQNIPLHPLIQPTRFVDVIFAVDSSADTNSSWPNGASLVATYERSRNKISNGTSFPAVPDVNTFLNFGLNARPTFFGCNSSNTTSPTPLVVYIPNAPYVYLSNVSTFDPTYNNSERDAIVANGYAVATLGNGTVDSQWPTCVGCAILSRSLERTKTKVPDVCLQCFKKYCWDGTVNSTSPAPYQPKIALAAINVKSSDASDRIQINLFSGIGIAMFTIYILGLWNCRRGGLLSIKEKRERKKTPLKPVTWCSEKASSLDYYSPMILYQEPVHIRHWSLNFSFHIMMTLTGVGGGISYIQIPPLCIYLSDWCTYVGLIHRSKRFFFAFVNTYLKVLEELQLVRAWFWLNT